MSEHFEREVIDRLARIETKVEHCVSELANHTSDDDARFQRVEDDLRDLLVAEGVRKKAARNAGAAWGAGAGAAIVALADAVRSLLLRG